MSFPTPRSCYCAFLDGVIIAVYRPSSINAIVSSSCRYAIIYFHSRRVFFSIFRFRVHPKYLLLVSWGSRIYPCLVMTYLRIEFLPLIRATFEDIISTLCKLWSKYDRPGIPNTARQMVPASFLGFSVPMYPIQQII